MHINLARTFLEVVEQGSFYAAAQRLRVTHSTVSMRIKALEDLLGRRVFVRSKARADLTAAGAQFRPHAELIIKTWHRACSEIVLPTGVKSVLSIGGEYSLWDSVLMEWVVSLRKTHSHVALQAELGDPEWIIRQLTEGLLDFGLVYTPNGRSGIVIKPLFVEKLILVSDKPRGVMRWSPDYVYMDWGTEFREAHSRTYPGGNRPSMTGNLGPMTVRFILQHGGSGYFPAGSVRKLIEKGQLFVVKGAPVFPRQVYLTHPTQRALPAWLAESVAGIAAMRSVTLDEDWPVGEEA
jgi:LysR family transcriptional regulator, flagellar master operon regulator